MFRILKYRTYFLYAGLCCVLFSLLCSNGRQKTGHEALKNNKERTERTERTERFPARENEVYVVYKDIDLHGKSYILSKNVTLRFNGGKIKHGTLIGNNTQIKGTKNLFDRVKIKGTWIVKDISAQMFVNANDTNVLQSVFALSNPQIYNTIYVPKGKYIVKAEKGNNKVLKIPSKTKLVLDGDICLSANRLTGYFIIHISNSRNVTIEGKGSVIGDRHSHYGKEGQWGMCVAMTDVKDVRISGIKAMNAWGDGIYVGKRSDSITIEKCSISGCRRQGISIIGGKFIRINNCEIKDIRGHAPEYAIDIEPNKRDTVVDIIIDNVIAKDCVGGFKSYSSKKLENYIADVKITNCRVIRSKKIPFYIMGANNVIINSSNVYDCKSSKTYSFLKSKNVKVNAKKINTESAFWENLYQ